MCKKMSVFCRKIWLKLTKLRSTCSKKNVRWKTIVSERTSSFENFVRLSKKLSASSKIFFFFILIFSFFFSFSELQRENISISSINFWRGCENCVSRAQRIFLRKTILFWKKNSMHFFSDLERKRIDFFVEKFSA